MESDKQLLKDNKTELLHHDSMNPETKKYEDIGELCVELEHQNGRLNNEVARLRELLEKVLFELERVPFQNPKLTAFTAHRLADRYREQLNQLNQ